jgi:anaerobic magnesium-protoporphyrin IX monomethyl ester cyclase
MRVLFTHSYFIQLDPKQVAHAQPYPPLGTMLAAAVLREYGYEVRLFDTMFRRHADEIVPVLEEFQPDVLVCYDDGFNYLTKMCLSNMREAAFRLMQHARDRGCTIIACSSDASDHAEKYLERAVDFVIPGEGELTLLALVESLSKGETNISGIAGIIYREDTEIRSTGKRPVSKTLDEFPLPAWDLIDMQPYRDVWMRRHGYFSLNVATTRGCPYSCNWCAKPIYGNAYHMRSPGKVVEEMTLLKEKFQIDHIWFCDDIFGLKRSWVTEFAQLVEPKGLKIRYKIQSRADLLIQENYVEALARSGCAEVWMGAESGSQRILDAMDKGTTVEQIRKARQLLAEYHIRAAYFLQFGYPGETGEDIDKTIALVLETMPDDIGISVSYPLPGTVFYDRVKEQLGEKTNWTDSDELALMFRNTYPPDFYKTLHRLVHALYRQKRARWRFRTRPLSLKGIRAVASVLKYSLSKAVHENRLRKLEHTA